MAGGRFNKLVGKTLPGTYVNFESGREKGAESLGERGTVLIPLLKPTYGAAKKLIKLTNASPDAAAADLGYSIYDNDANRQMLLIREAFKRASTVYVYPVTEGTKASASVTLVEADEENSVEAVIMTATAKHGGTRGNDYVLTITANVLGGFNVTIHLGGNKVVEYEALTTVEELIALDNPYITFTGAGNLVAVAGAALTGGTDAELTNADVSAFIDAWENVRFDTVCFPITGEDVSSLKQAALVKIKYMRENMGRGVVCVMPDASGMDYEGIINVTNSVELEGGTVLTHAEACAWVAAASAGASNTESLTNVAYSGAVAVVDAKSNDEAETAVKNGEFFFTLDEQDTVVVMYDINTLVNLGKEKDESYRKNRVIRVLDSFRSAVMLTFPPNKYDNDNIGWGVMEGIGKSLLKQFLEAGAIQRVDYDTDFLVDRENSVADKTFFNVWIWPVDSAEKLFFNIRTK